jgi:hypothetical protein
MVLFGAYAATVNLPASPRSRYSAAEAHRLLTAESIASDADVDLRDEYRTRAWRAWYPGTLHPTAGVTGGRLVEPQGIGFPLLIAPAQAVGGPTAVELWLAAVAALGFVLAAGLGRRLVPEPWATGAALVTGLSPPALAAATTIAPAMTAATALAGAALLALRVRESPRVRSVFWCAALVAVTPWLGVQFAAPAAVVALALARWLRRRQRGLAGFVALEVVFVSALLFISVNDQLYGGLTPYAARLAEKPPTGADDLGDYLARARRLVGLWFDRDAGMLRWAPFAALAFFGVWLLWRSRRDRIAVAMDEHIHVEVAAGFCAAVAAVVVVVAAFAAPTLHGDGLIGGELLPALPFGAALAAWGLRHARRAGAALAALTLGAGVWLLLGARLDGAAGLAPPRGALPWGGAEELLPRFGAGAGDTVLTVVVVCAVGALTAREAWRWRRRALAAA